MLNTKIEWADHTVNVWQGCTKVSPACDHCYAERMALTVAPCSLSSTSREISDEPAPTATHPALKNSPMVFKSTPPVGTIRKCGRGARRALCVSSSVLTVLCFLSSLATMLCRRLIRQVGVF